MSTTLIIASKNADADAAHKTLRASGLKFARMLGFHQDGTQKRMFIAGTPNAASRATVRKIAAKHKATAIHVDENDIARVDKKVIGQMHHVSAEEAKKHANHMRNKAGNHYVIKPVPGGK